MWICPQCKEESEDNFDKCWKCGTWREGAPSAEPSLEGNRIASDPPLTPLKASNPPKDGRRGMKHEYRVVPFIGRLKSGLFGSVEDAAEVSKQLEAVINQHASQGWEFVAVNDVNIEIKPGCLAGLFGGKTAYMPLDQVILKRANY